MIRRIVAFFILATIFIVPLLSLWAAPQQVRSLADLESYLKQNIVYQPKLKSLATRLRLAGGTTQQNGVLLSQQGALVKLLGQQQELATYQGNLRAIAAFVDKHNMPTYFMLVPTACAIKQQWLPGTVPLFNQKELIDESYQILAGKATAIDVYPRLFEKSEEYIYYNSDTALTTYGAYLLYGVMAQRMRLDPLPDTAFEKQHIVHNYRGNLYDSWDYPAVQADILTAYLYSGDNLAFTITHQGPINPRVYHTPYPAFYADTATPYNVILGGSSPRIELQTKGLYTTENLLFFGDRSTMAVLPFLALHYAQITFIDLSLYERGTPPQIDFAAYSQVLFGYDVDYFLSTSHPRKINDVQDTSPEA